MNATQEKTLVKAEILDELIVFLADDNLDNVDCPDDAIVQNDFNNHLTAIMASLGDKQPSHTVLHTLIFCALASSLEHTGGKLFLGEIISPEQQTPEQKQFVDVVAGHIGNQLPNLLQEKIENRDTTVFKSILKAREAFIQDLEVIGLVNLLEELTPYTSKEGLSALQKTLKDFDQFRTDTLEKAAELLPLVDANSNHPTP